MARDTPPAPALIVLLAALTLLLASCGGGSTAEPVAQMPVTTTPGAPFQAQSTPQSAPAATPTTPVAPRPSAATPAPRPGARAHAGRPRGSGGADAPPEPSGDGALADAPADLAGTPAADRQPAATPLDERAQLVLTRRVTNTHYFQHGTITGTYDGTMEVEARITSKGVLVRFTATLPGGTISGRGVAVAILDSTTWPGLRGRAILTGGTGRFAGIAGRGLKVTGRSKPDASRTRVRLLGTVTLG